MVCFSICLCVIAVENEVACIHRNINYIIAFLLILTHSPFRHGLACVLVAIGVA